VTKVAELLDHKGEAKCENEDLEGAHADVIALTCMGPVLGTYSTVIIL